VQVHGGDPLVFVEDHGVRQRQCRDLAERDSCLTHFVGHDRVADVVVLDEPLAFKRTGVSRRGPQQPGIRRCSSRPSVRDGEVRLTAHIGAHWRRHIRLILRGSTRHFAARALRTGGALNHSLMVVR
jgi:hypothetical protein